ncbi:MAG: molybdate ABC transporter substrate-binding protein [Dehalococcoidales bacterium]|nr:molybdate ABC transporter substrate-binding protein [Dehalococcoidales bacterium]
MKNRSVIMVLIVFAGLLMLVAGGCGNAAPTPSAGGIKAEPAEATQVSPLSESSGELLVFAAGGTKIAIDEAAGLFEQEYGVKVTINYGGGGEVLSNMIIAKKGDVYIAPEQRFMDSARTRGAIDSEGEAACLAYMIPVIGVREGNPLGIQSLSDLAKSGTRIAMGNPETTALGIITPEVLQKASLYEEVKGNIVTNAPQVNSIITMLKMNQVDTGFIWHYFDTTSTKDIDIVWIPPEYVTGIGIIQAAISTYSSDPEKAAEFVDFLTSPQVKEVFKNNGYIVDRQEADKYWLAE